jgi:hypothetical protein
MPKKTRSADFIPVINLNRFLDAVFGSEYHGLQVDEQSTLAMIQVNNYKYVPDEEGDEGESTMDVYFNGGFLGRYFSDEYNDFLFPGDPDHLRLFLNHVYLCERERHMQYLTRRERVYPG